MATPSPTQPPDYCTLWPDRLGKLDWSHCCAAHDLAYAELADKIEADLTLGLCVAQAGAPAMGLLMVAGLTVFGGIWWGASWLRRHFSRPSR